MQARSGPFLFVGVVLKGISYINNKYNQTFVSTQIYEIKQITYIKVNGSTAI